MCSDYGVSVVPPRHLASLGMGFTVQSVVERETTDLTFATYKAKDNGAHKPISHNIGGYSAHVTGW